MRTQNPPHPFRRTVPRRALIAGVAVVASGAIPLFGLMQADAAVQQLDFAPVADAQVSGAHNYVNYGSSTSLGVDASPILRSYVKFTVQGVSGTVSHATLRLFAHGASSIGTDVHGVIGNGWTESGIDFANAYAFDPVVSSTGPVANGTWVSLDVTKLISGNGTYGLVLTSSSKSAVTYGSKESSTPPQLQVTFGSTTASPSPSATASASPTASPTAAPTPSSSPTAAPTASPTSSPVASPPPTVPPTTHKLVIHHGFDLPTPGQVSNNRALIDSRPFDGITVNLTGLTDQTLYSTAHTQAEYAAALAPMPTMSKVTHNFVVVRTMNPVDWYNDAQWSTIASNFANLAAAERAKGQFDGIFFDTEYYGSGTYPWNYGAGTSPWGYSATAGATPGHQPSDASNEVMMRGQQIGSAIAGAWPQATLMSTYGPWVGETKTVSSGGWGSFGYNDTAYTNELMGAFTGGMVGAAANHPGFTYVDGGEVYQAHSTAEYGMAYNWEKNGLGASGSPVVPNVSSYSSAVSAGFGVYDKDMRLSGWPTMPASTWQTVLTNALKASDRYVWSYSEAYDWLGTGWPSTPVPADILTATSNARAAGA